MVQQIVPGVIEVDVVVGHSEVGVKRDADQSAVARILRRQVGERGRQQLPVLDYLDLPCALKDEDPPVRCDLETGRAVEAIADHQRGLEVGRRRGHRWRDGYEPGRQKHQDHQESNQPPPVLAEVAMDRSPNVITHRHHHVTR